MWPEINLGKGYSKTKPVCLDMPSPDMPIKIKTEIL